MIHFLYKKQVIQFIVMVIVGMLFNPMNILAYRINDLYISLTLFYSGLLMATNMIWSHEIIHYLSMNHFNIYNFFTGLSLSILISVILRKQLFVGDKQWLKRMIGHHSTAITTTTQLLDNQKNVIDNSYMYRLAKDIVYNQEREILFMKNML